MCFPVIIDDTVFDADVALKFAIPEEMFDSLEIKINEAFAGKIKLKQVGKRQDCR